MALQKQVGDVTMALSFQSSHHAAGGCLKRPSVVKGLIWIWILDALQEQTFHRSVRQIFFWRRHDVPVAFYSSSTLTAHPY